ncbi:hypothetical protein OF83DRAFT_846321 [Amylostereum chailletii]|nr:hypothetical protein OF83DRAFT_846321 [Amylostereum chailletii]
MPLTPSVDSPFDISGTPTTNPSPTRARSSTRRARQWLQSTLLRKTNSNIMAPPSDIDPPRPLALHGPPSLPDFSIQFLPASSSSGTSSPIPLRTPDIPGEQYAYHSLDGHSAVDLQPLTLPVPRKFWESATDDREFTTRSSRRSVDGGDAQRRLYVDSENSSVVSLDILARGLPAALYDSPRTPYSRHQVFRPHARVSKKDRALRDLADDPGSPVRGVTDFDRILRPSMPLRDFELRGWCAYAGIGVPDYFYHSATRTVTDIDLRSSSALNAISDMMNETGDILPPPEGWEQWLCAMSTEGGLPIQCWINHETKCVSSTCPAGHTSDQPYRGPSKNERLEMEVRYWSYVEAHPSHGSIYHRTISTAMSELKIYHAEHVLSIPGRSAPCLTFEECQTLTDSLRSLDDSPHTPSETAFTKATIAARIHLRIAVSRLSAVSPPNKIDLFGLQLLIAKLRELLHILGSVHALASVFYVFVRREWCCASSRAVCSKSVSSLLSCRVKIPKHRAGAKVTY